MAVKQSALELKCTKGLHVEVRGAARRTSHLSGAVSLAFLRGYQAGYEDCVCGTRREYARTSKKEIMKDRD